MRLTQNYGYGLHTEVTVKVGRFKLPQEFKDKTTTPTDISFIPFFLEYPNNKDRHKDESKSKSFALQGGSFIFTLTPDSDKHKSETEGGISSH